jgi:hypothetical protein
MPGRPDEPPCATELTEDDAPAGDADTKNTRSASALDNDHEPDKAEDQSSKLDVRPRLEAAEDIQSKTSIAKATEEDEKKIDEGGDLTIADGGAQANKMEDPVTAKVTKQEGSFSQEIVQATGGKGKKPEGIMIPDTEEHPDLQHQYHQSYPPFPPASPMPHHPYYGGYMYPPMYSYGGYPPVYPGHQPPYGAGGGHPPYSPYNNITPSGSSQPPQPPSAGGPSYHENAFVPPPYHPYPPTSPVVSPQNGAAPSGGDYHFDPYRHPNYGYAPYQSSGDDAGGSKYKKAMSGIDSSEDEGNDSKKTGAPLPHDDTAAGEDVDGKGTPRSNSRLQVYVKAKQTVPPDVLDRRARKNAASRARSAGVRNRIVEIELKPLSERTESETNLVELHNQRRSKKNERSRVRSIERKETIARILSLPEKKRSKLEKQFLEASLGARERKNQGDRMRRRRMKEMGDAVKMRRAATAKGMAGPGVGVMGGEMPGAIGPPMHPYHYPYPGYPQHYGGMMPPGYHPMMGYPPPGPGGSPYPEHGEVPPGLSPRGAPSSSPDPTPRRVRKTKQRSPLEPKTRLEV